MSLVLTFVVASLLFLAWRVWRPDDPPPIPKRVLSDVALVYKCDRNHAFRAMARIGPRFCPVCGQPAYPRAIYACESHGTFEVALRFGVDDNGVQRVMELRLPGRAWVSAKEPLRCPRCNRELEKLPSDPLEVPRRRGRDGG